MCRNLDGLEPGGGLPEGCHLETYAERGDIMEIIGCLEASFVDHYGFVEMAPEERRKRWEHGIKGNRHHDPSMWYLALKGKDLAGMCLCDPSTNEDPDMAYVAVLGVSRDHRRKGLGSALLVHTFHEMAA